MSAKRLGARHVGLVVGFIVANHVANLPKAEACSCMAPREVLVGPDRVDDAPLNTRVRFEVPSGAKGDFVLRAYEGARVETTARTFLDGDLTFVELTPKSPLAPFTRYEIAVVRPSEYPCTTVLGTFRTGVVADNLAPKLESVGRAVARGGAHPGGGNCSIAGPWIEVGPVKVSDPDQPNARLLLAVWMGDAAGNVDTSKPPTTILPIRGEKLTIGKSSLCDPHDVAIPRAPFVSLAVAAMDDAGNLSAPRKLRVDQRAVGAIP
ncbi:hypothetical protein [Labilithrix luteola]|nr:hypothetical protein [Labilithrix luteola]